MDIRDSGTMVPGKCCYATTSTFVHPGVLGGGRAPGGDRRASACCSGGPRAARARRTCCAYVVRDERRRTAAAHGADACRDSDGGQPLSAEERVELVRLRATVAVRAKDIASWNKPRRTWRIIEVESI